MRVLKFGGKSLSTIEKTQKLCKYIKKIYKNDKKIIIVVSAAGNTTNNLINIARQYGDNNNTPREIAKLLSTGETQSASLFSIMLNNIGVPAKSFSAHELQITTFGDYLNSNIAYINKKPIIECFEKEIVCVVSGFQGINKNNELTLLGRGGSDTTATALAGIFDITAEIYSDYDGIFSGDPKLFNFKKIKKASYELMIQMAKSGAKVLDSKSVEVAKKFNIGIVSKSSSFPEKQGSLISEVESDFISISTIEHLSQISINFSNNSKLKFIIKNVLSSLDNQKFYNLIIKQNKISFYVLSSDSIKIIGILSKKLNLLKQNHKIKNQQIR